jgi:hypothetical protein
MLIVTAPRLPGASDCVSNDGTEKAVVPAVNVPIAGAAGGAT